MKVKLPKLLNYQKEMFDKIKDDETKYITFQKSRQSGGSWFLKWLLVYWGVTEKDVRIGYITPTFLLSKLFFKELTKSAKKLIKSTNKSDLIIEFESGTQVQFFSGESHDSLRGQQFEYLLVDESSFMVDELWDEILEPTVLIKGRKVIMISTPKLKNGFFYRHVMMGNNNQKGYYTKRINIYDNPFVTKEQIEGIKKKVSQKVFDCEYLSNFIDGNGSVFQYFNECINDNPILNGEYYVGIDWGKQNDYTVLTIINSLKQVVHIERFNTIDYVSQVDKVVGILNKWKPQVVVSEENNIGQVVNELLKRNYKGRIERITLNNNLKREMVENLVVAFENKNITIPNNNILLNELMVFEYKYNPQTQSIKYNSPNGLHDDMVISLCYSYHSVTKMKEIKSRLR